MKFIWESSDVKPGRVVGTNNVRERTIIGYTIPLYPTIGRDTNVYLLISLADGMVWKSGTKAELAETLGRTDAVPEEILDSRWGKS